MPRKNKPNSALKTRRQKTKRGRRAGVRNQGAEGMAGDFAYAGASAERETGSGRAGAGRVLAVDYGERRVGLALSDPAGLIAQGLETLKTTGTGETLAAIVDIVEEEQVLEVILGMPVHMDGTAGEMAGKVEEFADRLRSRVSCEVRTWDERLTSVSAQRAMREMGRQARGNKGSLDRIAATLLLQNYLDFRRRSIEETDSRQ